MTVPCSGQNLFFVLFCFNACVYVCKNLIIDANKFPSRCLMSFAMFWHNINAKTSPAFLFTLLLLYHSASV